MNKFMDKDFLLDTQTAKELFPRLFEEKMREKMT